MMLLVLTSARKVADNQKKVGMRADGGWQRASLTFCIRLTIGKFCLTWRHSLPSSYSTTSPQLKVVGPPLFLCRFLLASTISIFACISPRSRRFQSSNCYHLAAFSVELCYNSPKPWTTSPFWGQEINPPSLGLQPRTFVSHSFFLLQDHQDNAILGLPALRFKDITPSTPGSPLFLIFLSLPTRCARSFAMENTNQLLRHQIPMEK